MVIIILYMLMIIVIMYYVKKTQCIYASHVSEKPRVETQKMFEKGFKVSSYF